MNDVLTRQEKHCAGLLVQRLSGIPQNPEWKPGQDHVYGARHGRLSGQGGGDRVRRAESEIVHGIVIASNVSVRTKQVLPRQRPFVREHP